MLVRKNGQHGYTLEDMQTIAPRTLTTEELDSAQLPPQVALTQFQTDWSAGLGGRDHRLDPLRYASGVKMDASVPGQAQLARALTVTTDDTAPTAYKPSGFAIVGTEVWSFQERDVYSLTYATNQWVKATAPQAVAVVYRNGVEYGANTYVPAWLTADDSAGTYIYRKDADANDGAGAGVEWTLSTLATKTFKYFARGRNAAGTEILIGANISASVPNTLYWATDPTNAGSWTLLDTIGNSDSAITGLISDGRTVLILKTNGVWAYYADGSVENLTPEFESMADPDNFRNAFNWNGHLLLPLGSGGMNELVEGSLYDLSMKRRYAVDQTNLHGRVVAIGGDSSRLFILVLDTTNTKYHLLMATWDTFESTQDFRWHHVGSITYTTSTVANHSTLFAEGIPSGSTLHHRIWVGIESGGSNRLPYFYPLPDPDDTNLAYSADDDSELVTVVWDALFAKENKLYRTIDVTTDNLGAGANDHYIEGKYRVDGGAWTFVTGTQSTSKLTSDTQTLTFATEVTGKTLELQFLFFQGTTTTTTPILKDFTVRGAIRMTAIKMIQVKAYLADNIILLNGARGGTVVADLAQLQTWNNGANEVILAEPDASTTRNVVFLPGTLKIQYAAVVSKRRTEYLISFALGVV